MSNVWSWLQLLRDRLVDARRVPRREGERRSGVLSAGGRDYRVRLIDVSEAGAMVAGDVALELGSAATLLLPEREPLRGHVRWARDGRTGLEFDRQDAGLAGQQDEE